MQIMKNNIIKWMSFLSIILILGTACQEQTEVYEEFVVPGGNVYPGVVVNPMVLSGANRVQVVGLKPMGADVNEIRVFWNYFTDSVSYLLNENTAENLAIEVAGLEEQSYLFTIRSYNNDGDVSVPLEVFGKSYGDKYAAALLNRGLNSVAYNELAEVEFDFDEEVFEGALYTEIRYTNNNEEAVFVRIPTDQNKATTVDFNPAKPLQYTTAYQPDTTCIDTFYCELTTIEEIAPPVLEVIEWSDTHKSEIFNFVDGNPATRWHTKVKQVYPHWAVIDMKIQRPVSAFEIWTHTGGEQGYDRAAYKFKLEISSDNTTWIDLGEFDFNRFDYSGGQMFYIPGNLTARYFKFTGLEGPDPMHMVFGEIGIYSDITEEVGKFYGTWVSTVGGIKQTVAFKNEYGFYSQDDAEPTGMNWSVANEMLTIDILGEAAAYSFSEDGKKLTVDGVGVFDKKVFTE
jgi:hypothetical protein